jgi:glutathione synthase/RimK-type ligase-like ATP-grasp enzyme
VSHPQRIRGAEYKPAQLATAAACGLAVPPTLVTNHPEQARQFTAHHGSVVYKPLWNTPYASEEGSGRTVWVEEVDGDALDETVAGTAHLFQKRLDKSADVRVTVVGHQLFAVRIAGATHLDWRQDYATLSYRLIDPPAAVEKGVRAYLDAFGLAFGAFDFGVDRDGCWWLYECNPNGQWAWFPEPIPTRIAAAIATQLQHSGGSA